VPSNPIWLGRIMLDFLEKLVYMILPNQIGFEGTSPFQVGSLHLTSDPLAAHPCCMLTMHRPTMLVQEVPPSQPPRPGKQPLEDPLQPKLFFSELKVSNLLLYPDFEPLFELFEPLQSMQVMKHSFIDECAHGPRPDLCSPLLCLVCAPTQVRFVVEGAPSPEVAAMLLSGYAMPVQPKTLDAEDADAA
jgi:hypothetical protein